MLSFEADRKLLPWNSNFEFHFDLAVRRVVRAKWPTISAQRINALHRPRPLRILSLIQNFRIFQTLRILFKSFSSFFFLKWPPICRTVFERDEVWFLFRFMSVIYLPSRLYLVTGLMMASEHCPPPETGRPSGKVIEALRIRRRSLAVQESARSASRSVEFSVEGTSNKCLLDADESRLWCWQIL